MSEPLEVKLTGRRRVVLDLDRDSWRVAYYAPDHAHEHVLSLERKAERGSSEAKEELEALAILRSTGQAKTLSDALTIAMSRRDPRRPYLLESPSLRDIEQISRYVLGRGYAA